MNIFSAKYKVHRLVNYIFYLIVFIFGFSVGFSAKNFDLKKFLPNILMIENVDAFNFPNTPNLTVDELYIYNVLENNCSNFDIEDYSKIYAYTNKISNSTSSDLYIFAFSNDSTLTIGSCNTSNYDSGCRYELRLNTGSVYRVRYNLKSQSLNYCSVSTTNDFASYIYPSTGWKMNNYQTLYGGSNFDFSSLSSSFNSSVNVLDFSEYLSTTYMSISYLDNSYDVISSTDCIYNTADYCSLSINSDTGSYIKVTYFLDNLLNRRLDFLPNTTYRLKTTLIGSNLDTRVSYINPWFYFNDSTQNVDSDLLLAFNKSISYFNDSYSYTSDFTIDDDYNSYSAYEISVLYNTNSSYYSTISIPYEFSLNDVTSGDTPIVEPTTPDDDINKDDIIIDQNSQLINNQNETNQNLTDINNSINNDNINGASSQASNFFSGFNTDTHGLTGIITAPLNLISSITSTTCSPLVLPVPFVNVNLTLPCLSSIYSQYFGSFLTIYQSITFGIVAYWVCVRIFNLVKDFKNPDHDEIEVLDL